MAQDTTEPITSAEESPLILEFTNTGGGNVTVDLIDLDTGEETLVFNAVGDFAGRTITPVSPGEYVLNVDYGESYTLEPLQMEEKDVRELPVEIEGCDWDVIPLDAEEPYRLNIDSEEARGNCTISLYDQSGQKEDLLINVVGSGQYATTVTKLGFGFLFVKFNGEWTLDLQSL